MAFPNTSDSGDSLPDQVRQALQNLYVKKKDAVYRYALNKIRGWYLPGCDAGDIFQDGWHDLEMWMATDTARKVRRPGESLGDFEERLLCMLFRIISCNVLDAIRKQSRRSQTGDQHKIPSLSPSLACSGASADHLSLLEVKDNLQQWFMKLEKEPRTLVLILMEEQIKRTEIERLSEELKERLGGQKPSRYLVKKWLAVIDEDAREHPILEFIFSNRRGGSGS